MRFATAFLLLFSAAANAQTVTYPASSSASVVTNVVAYQYITNGAFDTGSQGWFVPNNPGYWIWDSSGKYQALKGIDSEQRIVFGQAFTGTQFTLTFSVEITNTAAFYVQISDDGYSPKVDVQMPFTTGSFTIRTNILVSAITNSGVWLGTQFVFAVKGLDNVENFQTNGIFFDDITLSNVVGTSIATNSGSGASGSVSVGGKALGVSRR